MTELGYARSSEEHGPNDLVRHAALAEDSGVEFALLSDHFHPWIGAQGESPSSGRPWAASLRRPRPSGWAPG